MARRMPALNAEDRKKLARMQMLMPMVPMPLLVRRLQKQKAKRMSGTIDDMMSGGKMKEILIGAVIGYGLSKILK